MPRGHGRCSKNVVRAHLGRREHQVVPEDGKHVFGQDRIWQWLVAEVCGARGEAYPAIRADADVIELLPVVREIEADGNRL